MYRDTARQENDENSDELKEDFLTNLKITSENPLGDAGRRFLSDSKQILSGSDAIYEQLKKQLQAIKTDSDNEYSDEKEEEDNYV